MPVNTDVDEIFGFFRGRGPVTGDVVSPALSPEEWAICDEQLRMILADTPVVLWLALEPAKISKKARAVIEDTRRGGQGACKIRRSLADRSAESRHLLLL